MIWKNRHRGAIALSPIHSKAIKQTMARQRRKCALVFACNIAHADVLEAQLKQARRRGRRRPLPLAQGQAREDGGEVPGARTADPDFGRDVRHRLQRRRHRHAGILPRHQVTGVFRAGIRSRCTHYATTLRIARSWILEVTLPDTVHSIKSQPHRARRSSVTAAVLDGRLGNTGEPVQSAETIHKSATKCKGYYERFDQHYHGAICPHCGLRQTSVQMSAMLLAKFMQLGSIQLALIAAMTTRQSRSRGKT